MTGGARSGKSSFAERLAAASGEAVTYLATAQAFDAEMEDRIRRHRADRPVGWATVEEPLNVPGALRAAVTPTALLDCLSLWVSNLLLADHTDGAILEQADALLAAARARPGLTVLVTNEVGFGIVPDNALARRYRDVLGWVNQRAAAASDEAWLLVSGLPLPLKPAPRPSFLSPRSPMHPDLTALISAVHPADPAAMQAARERQAQLTKPAGALGDLESLAVRLAGVFGTEKPQPRGVAVLVAAGDHGVAQPDSEGGGVSAYPPEVTPAMVANFLADTPAGPGGAAVNAIARTVGARVYVMDAGVNADLPGHPALVRAAVRRGTRDLRREAAMTRGETEALVLAGAALARRAIEEGADLLIPGEMGIGNTTPAAALTARLLNLGPEAVTGRGTGVDDATLARKVEAVRGALDRHASDPADPLGVLADLGGFEIAAMLGMMLQAAASRRAVILDGFVEGSAALVGVALAPALRDFLFPAGECAEIGHAAQLAHLNLKPMFRLGLRLGEGTGGVLAAPLLLSAAATLREMRTFAEAGVPGGG
ncbi:nicotinate-nucleotide-dimethylbenzimidazole phosphoribosyltransferase [Deinococcus phoenicis]|uniref:Nicotinate-nucleotide--dimethylbenzimidazole phosphoribosyltransferase n=2 Tax=Deinococcus phoenicis TaxID=1476583 RepID=A0A016QSZ5_9DEIO|nr:nicotinate-nucleotide-dimethylbenzimidazole phosphoribosyltransferase [Deinococcus phoenicis]